ncbi:hypothetical protein Tco_0734233 [Tanacetum coccineum]
MLSVRNNRLKESLKKNEFNNKDAARFDKKKGPNAIMCSSLVTLLGDVQGRQLDSKASTLHSNLRTDISERTPGLVVYAASEFAPMVYLLSDKSQTQRQMALHPVFIKCQDSIDPDQQAIIFNILEGLAVITNCTWMREDGELLLRPQQVTTEKMDDFVKINRSILENPINKTPNELLSGKVPNISHLKPFGCHVTILNTSDHLGKFEGKADEGFNCLLGIASHKAWVKKWLQRQEHEANDTAEKYGFGFSKDTEELLRQVDKVPAGSLDPAASNSAGSIDPAASISAGPAEPFSIVIELVHADETSTSSWSLIGLKNLSSVASALNDSDWVEAMQEEMQQFINQKILHFPKHVYKVVKALYGLHQAPRAIPSGWISVSSGDARVPTGSFTGSYCLTTSYWLCKLTFHKNKFSPQWRFLVHTLQHCLSSKSDEEDETLGGSFHTTPPRSTQVPPEGPTSGGAEDLATLTALSSLVSELVQKVSTLESELQAHKLLFKEVVGTLVKKVKDLELKLTYKGAGSPPHPTSDVPTTEVPTDVPSVGAPTGPSTVSLSPYYTATLHQLSEMPERFKGVYVEEPTQLMIKTFNAIGIRKARQMSQDFEMTEDQRKRQQEVLASAANYSDAVWDIILAPRMVAGQVIDEKNYLPTGSRRREKAYDTISAQQYMRIIFKNMFDKSKSVAFTMGLKRDGSPMSSASSKKLKTGDDEVNVEAPSHGYSAAQVRFLLRKLPIEDLTLLQYIAFYNITIHASSLQEEGDPEAEHKVCLKYASDADSASDDDTPVNLYAVVDWELLPTGLGSINVFYRLDKNKKAEGVGFFFWGDLEVLLDSPEVNDGISGLVLHMLVDKKYPPSVSHIEMMLDPSLEICREQWVKNLPLRFI